MRRLLTGGIKAILAIAALSTAAHWVLRVQRETPVSPLALADLSDPVTTGSITPGRTGAIPADFPVPDVTKGLDQRGLSELFAGAAPEKAKIQKAVVRR